MTIKPPKNASTLRQGVDESAYRRKNESVFADLGANFLVWACVFCVLIMTAHLHLGVAIDLKLPLNEDSLPSRYLEFVGVHLWIAQLAGAMTALGIAIVIQQIEGESSVAPFRARCEEECFATLKTFAALFLLSVPVLMLCNGLTGRTVFLVTADINWILGWTNVGLLKVTPWFATYAHRVGQRFMSRGKAGPRQDGRPEEQKH